MKKILPWVFSIFCGLCAFAYIPHFSAIIFAVGCILSLPIPKIREFLGSKGLSGKFKGVLLTAILFAGIMATPTAPKIQGPNEPARDVTSVDESEPNEPIRAKRDESESEQQKYPEKSNKETSTSGSAQNKQDSAEKQIQTNAEAPERDVPVPEPTHEPLQEPSPEVQPKPEPERTIRGRSSNAIVYVSKRSNTIHSVNDCGGMKNYREMTLGEADGRGYDYCPNCW